MFTVRYENTSTNEREYTFAKNATQLHDQLVSACKRAGYHENSGEASKLRWQAYDFLCAPGREHVRIELPFGASIEIAKFDVSL